MDLEAALKILLGEDVEVSAIAGTRIFCPVVPQTERQPAIAFRTVDEIDEYTLDGDWTTVVRVRIFSVAIGPANYAIAKALDRAIRGVLRGFSGTVSDGASPESTFAIQAIFRKQCRYQQYVDQVQTHEWVSDYEIHATEP